MITEIVTNAQGFKVAMRAEMSEAEIYRILADAFGVQDGKCEIEFVYRHEKPGYVFIFKWKC